MSYELSIIEKKIGSPEKPLSDLGKYSYLAWWTQRIIEFIRECKKDKRQFTLKEMSEETGIKLEDIQDALERVNLIKKSQNQVYLCTEDSVIDSIYNSMGRPSLKVNLDNLHWTPYMFPTDPALN